jgi:fatty-acyl-CoA synthase
MALTSLGRVEGCQDLFGANDTQPICDDRASEDDDAFILYTSGTTGRPKGVLLDHHRAVWAAMSQILSFGARDRERYLHLTPMYHSGGTTLLNATTLLGGTHIVSGAFDPAATLEAIERDRASWIFGVPTMYQFMMRQPDVATRDLSSCASAFSVQRRCLHTQSRNCWRPFRVSSSTSNAGRPRPGRRGSSRRWRR